MTSVLTALLAVVIAAGAAIVLVEAVHWVVRRLGRRSTLLNDLANTAHRPFLATVTIFAVQQAVRGFAGPFPGRAGVLHALVILVIAAIAWLVGALLLVLEDLALARWRVDVPDNMKARRVKTQVVMLRRVTVAGIVVLTVGVMLMTFPNVRALGASLIASAGLISVIAALAAQSTLGNLIAGLQLAFSDAVRIDDVVVVEGEWGRIEELTLTYVAVQIWDDRRLILPTSYFTTKPFQNWTRTGSAVLGTAEIDVDWSAPVEPMRAELRAVCEGTELWDGRVCVLQVTEATGGMIRLRALVSAHDAGSLWDLRCLVRERLVGWVFEHQRDSLPRLRADVARDERVLPGRTAQPPAADRPADEAEAGGDARVFGGTGDGDERAVAFSGPDEQAAPAGSGMRQ
ncbi:mechanosensitive ion channel protein MscS [Actinoplanes sp. ATCC 53533]|uniref:mechanosensitive ion channel family protein n=1 Tax=Actinoplanes sp. ATCC 53533 TaxID=1288362 RepID=UPI000F79B1E0|nr:mechanosensitive ion channel domain-containing protein [Actinoplanes sp. ATCC 53533]RSM60361.1 mechanosensitive ion channel protein MscS [Actinoplanes sp. ATCC 53533]